MQMGSFGSTVGVIFMSTHAIVRLQMSGLDVLAPSLSSLLRRELELEYVGARAGFMSGLLAFLSAQAIRARLSWPHAPELSACATCLLLSSAFSLLTYNNACTIHYGGYTGLLYRCAQLQTELIFSNLKQRKIAPAIALASFLASIFYASRLLYSALVTLSPPPLPLSSQPSSPSHSAHGWL